MNDFKTIAILNEEHQIYLVQEASSGKLYVKKTLSVYNKGVYDHLISHPIHGIPKIFHLSEENQVLQCVEEYIPGETLQEKINNGTAFSNKEIIRLISQLCDILHPLHQANPPIIHRDIKPSNLIVSNEGTLYLIDFNAAKFYHDDTSEDTMLLGTHGYAAPEQYGFGNSSVQTDIYAIGMLIKSLLSVSRGLLNSYEIAALETVIGKCTMLEAGKRYESVLALKSAIAHKTQWRKYLPPGFRQGKLSHIIPATLVYSLIFYLCLTLEVENSTPASLWTERIGLLLTSLSFIACICNYQNIQRHFPLYRHDNHILRILGAVLFSIAVALVLLLLTIILAIILE